MGGLRCFRCHICGWGALFPLHMESTSKSTAKGWYHSYLAPFCSHPREAKCILLGVISCCDTANSVLTIPTRSDTFCFPHFLWITLFKTMRKLSSVTMTSGLRLD